MLHDLQADHNIHGSPKSVRAQVGGQVGRLKLDLGVSSAGLLKTALRYFQSVETVTARLQRAQCRAVAAAGIQKKSRIANARESPQHDRQKVTRRVARLSGGPLIFFNYS